MNDRELARSWQDLALISPLWGDRPIPLTEMFSECIGIGSQGVLFRVCGMESQPAGPNSVNALPIDEDGETCREKFQISCDPKGFNIGKITVRP